MLLEIIKYFLYFRFSVLFWLSAVVATPRIGFGGKFLSACMRMYLIYLSILKLHFPLRDIHSLKSIKYHGYKHVLNCWDPFKRCSFLVAALIKCKSKIGLAFFKLSFSRWSCNFRPINVINIIYSNLFTSKLCFRYLLN